MGANSDNRTYFTDDKRVVSGNWDYDVQQSQHMDGCSYSGAIGMLDGSIDWVRIEPFNSQAEAEDYISENARKWDGPMAVPFKIKGAKAVPAYVKNAKTKYDQAMEKQRQIVDKAHKDVTNAKGQFVGCKKCKSKINRSYLKIADCPLCGENLISATNLQRIENAKQKSNKMLAVWKEALTKAREANCTGKIGYVVGGICSS